MKIVKTLVMLVGSLCLATACSNDNNNENDGGVPSCGDAGDIRPEIVTVGGLSEARNMEIAGDSFSSGEYYLNNVDDFVSSLDYVIRIETDYDFVVAKRAVNPLSFFINSAHACSLAPYFVADEAILDIDITSDTGFRHIRAGESLRSIFDIQYLATYYEFNTMGLESYLAETPTAPVNFSLKLKFNAIPATVKTRTFIITYTLQNGEEYSISTDPIHMEVL